MSYFDVIKTNLFKGFHFSADAWDSFKKFCSDIGKRSITEFNYRYATHREAHVFVGVELQDKGEGQALLESLYAKGYEVQDLSDNEMAKLHTRYMVGGHPHTPKRELIYRFEFPERPGALQLFLNTLGSQWNISLFHYRNHGSAYGRVLLGLHVEKQEEPALQNVLKKLNYDFFNETDNIAHQLFLR